MTSPESESRPLKERWLPQASIRSLLLLVGASALVMYTFRAAFAGNQFWAKIASLLIATTLGCFAAYAIFFFAANLVTASIDPLRRAVESSQPARGDSTVDGGDS